VQQAAVRAVVVVQQAAVRAVAMVRVAAVPAQAAVRCLRQLIVVVNNAKLTAQKFVAGRNRARPIALMRLV
jgi:hypothetical protein